ncbi:hypothetical protein ACFYZ9_37540 [Streptomyces sp. NPDC001691]|uniref:hypothetical protein n=1 Tax=Streptomyces sp. NPDC001691 TaxID=3364600 RepID=UPI00368E6379
MPAHALSLVYATAALAGAAGYLLLHWLAAGALVTALVSAGTVLVLRLTAVFRGLHLPALWQPVC